MLSLFFATTFAENTSDTANFNILHGMAYYDEVVTTSQAPSVHRNIYTPYLMYGHNLVSFDIGATTNGIASYNSDSHTSFIGLLDYNAVLGIATKSFGISFEFSLDEKLDFSEEKDAYHKDESTEIVGRDNTFLLRFSMPLQTLDFAATLRFMQSGDSIATEEYADSEGKNKLDFHRNNYNIYGALTLTNRPSAKNFYWSSGLRGLRYVRTTDQTYKSTIDPDDNYHSLTNGQLNYIYANLFYNFGCIVLKSRNARLHVGNNASLYASLFDQIEDKDSHRKDFYVTGSLDLTPNILAEYAFNENWMIWGTTRYTWSTSANHEDYTEYWKDEAETKNKFSRFSTTTGRVYLSTGVLFKYKQLTLEGAVESELYNNPFRGFNRRAMLYDFSGLVEF